MPSRSEGLPMAMLEAMSCGCVPVISNVGNVKDAAHDGENAFVVDDYLDIEAFVDRIHQLLDDEELRNEMSKNCVKLILEKYTLEKQTEIAKNIINYGENLK